MLSSAPSKRFEEITPSDSATLKGVRGLYVSVAGNLELKDEAGTAATFTSVAAGTVLPVSPSVVMATGTTATVVALY